MGAWGAGNFENDDALELIEALPGKDVSYIRKALTTVAETTDDWPDRFICGAALAAAETVAALKNAPHANLPDKIRDWAQTNQNAFDSSLVDLSRQVLARVKANSEVKEMWGDGEYTDAWNQELEDLENRLTK